MCAINSVCDALAGKSRNRGILDGRLAPVAWNCCRGSSFGGGSTWKGQRRWVILPPSAMNRSLHVSVAPGRKMAGWVCLLAVMLLWAPLWAMALEASAMGCCADGFCGRATHEHQKTNQAVKLHPAPAETPMECEHQGGAARNKAGAMKCSLSCCHEGSEALAAAVLFILPRTAPVSVPLGVAWASPKLTAAGFTQSIEPLSPPPRITPPSV